jgi:hypothetical protein
MLLLLLLYFIFKFSYNPGIDTMKESKYKYKVAGWLQEIARNNNIASETIYHEYALTKNDALVSDYLLYRKTFLC